MINKFKFFRGYVPISRILEGIRGTTIMEAGYVYAPYIPVLLEPEPVYEPFRPNSRITTKYATSMIDGRFYKRVSISGT